MFLWIDRYSIPPINPNGPRRLIIYDAFNVKPGMKGIILKINQGLRYFLAHALIGAIFFKILKKLFSRYQLGHVSCPR